MQIDHLRYYRELFHTQTDGPDSDEEDDIIKPDDNLLLVGHVESDASVLEVYSKSVLGNFTHTHISQENVS